MDNKSEKTGASENQNEAIQSGYEALASDIKPFDANEARKNVEKAKNNHEKNIENVEIYLKDSDIDPKLATILVNSGAFDNFDAMGDRLYKYRCKCSD